MSSIEDCRCATSREKDVMSKTDEDRERLNKACPSSHPLACGNLGLCCPSGYPWLCISQKKCYKNEETVEANCSDLIQLCNGRVSKK